MGVKDKGRPAKADDNELGLLAGAVTEAAEKGRLAKGAGADAKASLGAGVAHSVERPWGAAAAGSTEASPEKDAGSGAVLAP